MKKTNWVSYGATVLYTLFFVFCFFFIINSKFSARLAELNLQAAEHGMPMSTTPKNLERAPESFRLNLTVESRDFPIEEMTKTKAWSKPQNIVAGYARRLELMEGQHRKQSFWAFRLSVVSMIGAVLCRLLGRRNNRKETPNTSENGKTGADPV